MISASYFQTKIFLLHTKKVKANTANHELLNLGRICMGFTMLFFQLFQMFKIFHSKKLGKIKEYQ